MTRWILGLSVMGLLVGCIPEALQTTQDEAAIAAYTEASAAMPEEELLSETDIILMGVQACVHWEEASSLKSAAESYMYQYRGYTPWQSQTMFRVGLETYCPEYAEEG